MDNPNYPKHPALDALDEVEQMAQAACHSWREQTAHACATGLELKADASQIAAFCDAIVQFAGADLGDTPPEQLEAAVKEYLLNEVEELVNPANAEHTMRNQRLTPYLRRQKQRAAWRAKQFNRRTEVDPFGGDAA